MHEDKLVEFTAEMKEEYTILGPMMLPIHFKLLEQILNQSGYKVKILQTTGRSVVDMGLRSVHNDTCYPALLVIGQLIEALKSGEYDVHKTALLITQTGGGCRASNYIYLLRKALKQSGLGHVPVISINFAKLEEHSGFSIGPKLLLKAMYAFIYGDLLLWLSNQCKPYEVCKGDTDRVLDRWVNELCKQFATSRFMRVADNYKRILNDFGAIKREWSAKIQVGIVGEIYMKYAPLGNNGLEQYLLNEGAEPVVSGVLDFVMYTVKNSIVDYELYGKSSMNRHIAAVALKLLERSQQTMINSVRAHGVFRAPCSFKELEEAAEGFIHKGAKMGEGWLLTAEMVELIKGGINNIVCAQPFGCLPNHIVAKGMMRKIKDHYPLSNVVAIDYDPSATAINQENRLKLMLSNARLTQQIKEFDRKDTVKPVFDASKSMVRL